jgi:hypothetical protein
MADIVKKKYKKSMTAVNLNIESDLKDVIEESESGETDEERKASFQNSSPVASASNSSAKSKSPSAKQEEEPMTLVT